MAFLLEWIPAACQAGIGRKSRSEAAHWGFGAVKGIISCAEGASSRLRAEKGIISGAERDANRLPSRKTAQFLRGRCPGGIWGRNRHHFLRGTGYQPPAGQKIAPNPARMVLRGGSRQKKVSFPARNGIPTACHLPPATSRLPPAAYCDIPGLL